MAIRVSVRLHTVLRRKTPEGIVDRLEFDLPDGATVQTLLDVASIPLSGDALLLVVNGRIVKPEQGLSEGDQVRLIPAMSGG
jgi:molybdopterin converting factor small subunit